MSHDINFPARQLIPTIYRFSIDRAFFLERRRHKSVVRIILMTARNQKDQGNESESRQHSHSLRTTHKARNAVAQAAQQEFLQKNINSNNVKDRKKPHPLDFFAFSDDILQRYTKKYDLHYPPPLSLNGDILSSEIGKKTFTYKNNLKYKISKQELSRDLKKHFMALQCRENEVISNFLYKVKNQDKDLRLTFK